MSQIRPHAPQADPRGRPHSRAVEFRYHYRLIATIVLAEAARQVGARPSPKRRAPPARWPRYERALAPLPAPAETLFLDELETY